MEIKMHSTYDYVLDEWKSMYREEIGNIWKTERKELRRVAIVYHILKREFARIEFNLNHEMDSFREKLDTINNLKESNTISGRPESPPCMPLKINNSDDSQLNRSPKLNKYRKTSNLKKSKSLFHSTKNNHVVPTIKQKRKTTNTLTSSYDSPLDVTSPDDSTTDNKSTDSDMFKTPQSSKRVSNPDVVDSSFIVQETPDIVEKKFKWTSKKKSLKGNKSLKTKENRSTILDHLIRIPNETIKVRKFEYQNAEPITIKDKQGAPSLDDHTFCALVEVNDEDLLKKGMQHEEDITVPNKFIKNYDKFPVQRSRSPQHVHKTETVRRKADRMKLPGWSCSECEKYYNALDLPLEELRKKMNACSKHRNKFENLDTTPKGFWDVAMPATQENDDIV